MFAAAGIRAGDGEVYVAGGMEWMNQAPFLLGHPIGASGARIVATLLHELQRRGGRYGMATLCLGGGGSVAMAFERV